MGRSFAVTGAITLCLIVSGCSSPEEAADRPDLEITTSTSAQAELTTSTTTSTTSTTVLQVDPGVEIAIAGNPLPQFEPENERAISLIAPEVRGASFDGTPVGIVHNGNTYKMVVFLAHWCPHCQTEVPEVRDWLASYDLGDAIEIISVSTGERQDRPNWPPSEWLQREEWPVPVIEDTLESDVAVAYGLQAYPYWVFLDKDGSVLLRANGLSSEALTQISEEIKAFDAGATS